MNQTRDSVNNALYVKAILEQSTRYASGVSKIHHQTTLVSNGSKSTIFLSHDVESVGLMTSSPVLQSKKDSKDQKSIQSSTKPVPQNWSLVL